MKSQNKKFGGVKKALFKKKGPTKRQMSSETFQGPVKKLQTLTKTIQTKSGTIVCTDSVEIAHNNFVTISAVHHTWHPGPGKQNRPVHWRLRHHAAGCLW